MPMVMVLLIPKPRVTTLCADMAKQQVVHMSVTFNPLAIKTVGDRPGICGKEGLVTTYTGLVTCPHCLDIINGGEEKEGA